MRKKLHSKVPFLNMLEVRYDDCRNPFPYFFARSTILKFLGRWKICRILKGVSIIFPKWSRASTSTHINYFSIFYLCTTFFYHLYTLYFKESKKTKIFEEKSPSENPLSPSFYNFLFFFSLSFPPETKFQIKLLAYQIFNWIADQWNKHLFFLALYSKICKLLNYLVSSV